MQIGDRGLKHVWPNSMHFMHRNPVSGLFLYPFRFISPTHMSCVFSSGSCLSKDQHGLAREERIRSRRHRANSPISNMQQLLLATQGRCTSRIGWAWPKVQRCTLLSGLHPPSIFTSSGLFPFLLLASVSSTRHTLRLGG